jgi:Sporulation initiation factor Spo0A C terminal.
MDELTIKINKRLDSEGINHAKLGYRYLIKAIEIVLENPTEPINLNSAFTELGEQSKRSASSIERAVRYVVAPTGLTTKEFIMKVADSIYYNSYNDIIYPINDHSYMNNIDVN